MALIELRRLWALHQVDHGLLQIKAQIQGLDIGQREAEQIKRLEEENEPFGGKAKLLTTELKDLELQEKDLIAKSKRIDGLLYGGKPMAPKEIHGYEVEQEGLKKKLEEVENKMLGIMEDLPSLEPKGKEFDQKIEALKLEIAKKRKAALAAQAHLQEEFKHLAGRRSGVAKEVNPTMLPQYEALRTKRQGVAMALITPTFNCSECGMKVAEKSVEMVRDGKVLHCESCQRILYWTDGVT